MPASAVRRHCRWALPLAIVLVAVGVRLVFLGELRQAPTFAAPEGGDSIFYDRVASGERDDTRAYFHSPLYDWFISGSYRIFGRNLVALRLLQHLLGAAAALLVYVIAWRLFRRRDVAALAGLLQACLGPAVFHEGQLLPDALLPFLVALAALAVLRHDRRHTPTSGLLLGVCIGLAALARPTILLWVPALLLWTLLTQRRKLRRAWPGEVLLLVGTLLTIAPATLRNYLVERDLVLVTGSSGLNLYIGNNPNARGTYNLPEGMWFRPGDPFDDFSGIKAATRALGREPSSSELSRWWRQRATAWMRQNPRRTAELALLKLGLWLNNYEYPQLYNYYGYRRICPILRYLPTAGLLIAPGLVGVAWVTWRLRRRGPRLLALCTALFALAFVPFFVADRYRVAWLVLVAPFAAWIVATTVRAFARRQLLAGWRVCVGLVPAALLCFWPLSETPTLAPQLHAFARAAEARGELARAATFYRETLAEERSYGGGEADARLGRVLLRLGRGDEAERQLRDALHQFPGSGEVRHALGLVHLRRGQAGEAEEALLAATRLTPALTEAWRDLAEAKVRRGDLAGAVEAYRSALTLADVQQAWIPEVRAQLRRLEAQLRAKPAGKKTRAAP